MFKHDIVKYMNLQKIDFHCFDAKSWSSVSPSMIMKWHISCMSKFKNKVRVKCPKDGANGTAQGLANCNCIFRVNCVNNLQKAKHNSNEISINIEQMIMITIGRIPSD